MPDCVTCGKPAVYLFEGNEPMCLDCPEPRPKTERPAPPKCGGRVMDPETTSDRANEP